MSKIQAIIGGKQKGIADQVTIDPALGCRNNCVGCYARKSSQRGKNYEKVVEKELDRKILTSSLCRAKNEGFNVARVGKHCDPGDHVNSLLGILKCCSDESFKCIVVSKSLPFSYAVAELLRNGNHILHLSLGPYSVIVPSDEEIIRRAAKYREMNIKVFIRFTRDVTECMLESDKWIMKFMPYIVTPMRFASRDIMNFYHHNKPHEEDFDFVNGYWRPNKIHKDWKPYMRDVCGEIDGRVRCCNCGINLGSSTQSL